MGLSKKFKTLSALETVPRIGDTLGMMLDPTQFLLTKYRKHGPVCELKTAYQTYVVLGGTEAATFLSSREGRECLTVGDAWKFVEDEFRAHRTLVTTDGQDHKELRGVLQRGYSRDAMDNRYDEAVEVVDAHIDAMWATGSSVPVLGTMQSLVIQLIGRYMSGSTMPNNHVDSISFVSSQVLKIVPVQQVPRFLLRRKRYRNQKRLVTDFAAETIRRATAPEETYVDSAGKPTLLDDIITAYHRAEGDVQQRQNSLFNALLPYFAGVETSSSSTALALYMVLSHAELLPRIRAELDELFAANSLDHDSLARGAPTLSGAINETMRLHPVAATLVRFARKDFEFCGRPIRKGAKILVATSVPHFLAECYDEPERFDVTRYTGRGTQHRKPGAYSPFGRGEHMCIGKGIAESMMLIILARLLYRLDVMLDPPHYRLRKQLASTAPSPKMSVLVLGRRSAA